MLGQEDEADIQSQGHLACALCGRQTAVGAGGKGLHHAHFGVHWERLDVLHVAHIAQHALQTIALLDVLGQSQGRVVLVEEGRYLYLIHPVLVALYLESAYDGVLVADLDGPADLLCGVGYIDDEVGTQQHLVVGTQLEIYRLLVDLLASEVSAARRSGGVACGGEEVAADEAVCDVEEPLVLHLGHAEESLAVDGWLLLLRLLGLLGLLSLLALLAFLGGLLGVLALLLVLGLLLVVLAFLLLGGLFRLGLLLVVLAHAGSCCQQECRHQQAQILDSHAGFVYWFIVS